MTMLKLTAGQTAAMEALAAANGLVFKIQGSRCGMKYRGLLAAEVVYDAAARPGRQWDVRVRTAALLTLAREMRAVLNAG